MTVAVAEAGGLSGPAPLSLGFQRKGLGHRAYPASLWLGTRGGWVQHSTDAYRDRSPPIAARHLRFVHRREAGRDAGPNQPQGRCDWGPVAGIKKNRLRRETFRAALRREPPLQGEREETDGSKDQECRQATCDETGTIAPSEFRHVVSSVVLANKRASPVRSSA